MAESAAVVRRRAPRLRADQHIAPYITRTGRFAARDPERPGRLPGLDEVLGFAGWALFMGGVLWWARRSSRPS